VLEINDLALDTARHELRQNHQAIELTPLEFQLIQRLMQSAGKVVKRVDLSMEMMENGYTGSESTIKIHIRNLRVKLGDDPDQPRYIETVFGIGYRFIGERA